MAKTSRNDESHSEEKDKDKQNGLWHCGFFEEDLLSIRKNPDVSY